MRILIVVPSQDRISGNWITASRFQHGLERQGHQVVLQDTPLRPQKALRQCLVDFAPDVALLLHAYRSGKPWLEVAGGLNIPCVVLLTGTDVNQGLDDPAQREVIRTVLDRSAAVLVHNPLIAANFSANHPELSSNLRVLSPGIALGTEPYDLRTRHTLPSDVTLFLCPAGLRPVKGLLELLEMFDPFAGTIRGLYPCLLRPSSRRRLQRAHAGGDQEKRLGQISRHYSTAGYGQRHARGGCHCQQFAQRRAV